MDRLLELLTLLHACILCFQMRFLRSSMEKAMGSWSAAHRRLLVVCDVREMDSH
jgi:hypothetical protein